MIDEKKCPQCAEALPPDAPDGLCPKCLLSQGFLSTSGEEDAVNVAQRGLYDLPDPKELTGLFDQLEVEEFLGQGGMGAVYKARQLKLDRLVALKILPPRSGSPSGFAERFNREARTLAKLDHPNIIRIHDFGEVTPSPLGEEDQVDGAPLHYIIMEHISGPNLRRFMRENRMKEGDVVVMMNSLCDALQYAHEEGVIHRDIKPENILIDARGRIKVADFGLAKLSARIPGEFTLTKAHQVMGTPHYMAPEQLERPGEVDHRADIFSLGVILYEMLTGELPIGSFTPPSEKVGVDPRFDGIVTKALAKEPERRYQTVNEMQYSLKAMEADSGQPPAGKKARKEARQPILTVPFTVPSDWGFITAHGIIRLTDDVLVLEYQEKQFWGLNTTPFKEVRIPLNDLHSMEVSGIVQHTVRIRTSSLSMLSSMPGIVHGELKLAIERKHRPTAETLAGLAMGVQPPEAHSSPDGILRQYAAPITNWPAISMILIGTLGLLGFLDIFGHASRELLFGPSVIQNTWRESLAFRAPFLLLMIVGFNMKLFKAYEFNMIICILLILTVVGAPLGLWGIIALTNSEVRRAYGRPVRAIKNPTPLSSPPPNPVARKFRSLADAAHEFVVGTVVREKEK